MSLITCSYISSRQKSLKFESWFMYLSSRSQSFLDNNTTQIWVVYVVVSTWSLSDCCLQCFTVSDFYVRFGIVRLQAARYPVVRAVWYRRYSRYLRRLTVFFTATIYRDIPWPWRYWYRHLGIDDKYRGIAGIAQHYYVYQNSGQNLEIYHISRLLNYFITIRWYLFSSVQCLVTLKIPFKVVQGHMVMMVLCTSRRAIC